MGSPACCAGVQPANVLFAPETGLVGSRGRQNLATDCGAILKFEERPAAMSALANDFIRSRTWAARVKLANVPGVGRPRFKGERDQLSSVRCNHDRGRRESSFATLKPSWRLAFRCWPGPGR